MHPYFNWKEKKEKTVKMTEKTVSKQTSSKRFNTNTLEDGSAFLPIYVIFTKSREQESKSSHEITCRTYEIICLTYEI